MAWLFYPVKNSHRGTSATILEYGSMEAYIPNNETEVNRNQPEERKGYPVWRIKPPV